MEKSGAYLNINSIPNSNPNPNNENSSSYCIVTTTMDNSNNNDNLSNIMKIGYDQSLYSQSNSQFRSPSELQQQQQQPQQQQRQQLQLQQQQQQPQYNDNSNYNNYKSISATNSRNQFNDSINRPIHSTLSRSSIHNSPSKNSLNSINSSNSNRSRIRSNHSLSNSNRASLKGSYYRPSTQIHPQGSVILHTNSNSNYSNSRDMSPGQQQASSLFQDSNNRNSGRPFYPSTVY
ncbi:hypothetical protein U3516DRAFT_901649 [Neocallimastix sp. 'constans']